MSWSLIRGLCLRNMFSCFGFNYVGLLTFVSRSFGWNRDTVVAEKKARRSRRRRAARDTVRELFLASRLAFLECSLRLLSCDEARAARQFFCVLWLFAAALPPAMTSC